MDTHGGGKQGMDVFIMGGQSNMQGRQGNAEQYPLDPSNLDREILFYWVTPGFGSSEGQWSHMQPQPGCFPCGHFGPEVTFARRLQETGSHPAIFKFSRGATSLAKDWLTRGEKALYDQMDLEYRKALSFLKAQGYPVNLRAFVWIQGESDAETAEMSEGYFARLTRLVKDVREHLAGDPSLPVILGLDEQHPYVKTHPVVVDAQKRFVQEDTCAAFVSMEGLEKADVSHLTPAGLEAHGRRLFDTCNALMKRVEKKELAKKRARSTPS